MTLDNTSEPMGVTMLRHWNSVLFVSACVALAGCAAEACPEGEIERDGVCVPTGSPNGHPDAGTSDAAITGDMDASIDEEPSGRRDSGSEAPITGERDSGMDAAFEPEPDAGGNTTTPVDACETAACDDNASCDDSGDAPVCECNPGFEGDGMQCTRNECIPLDDDAAPCGAHASCEDPSPSVGSNVKCTCEASFASCDGSGDPQPGCETNLNTNADHCGACGYTCLGNFDCDQGVCEQAAHKLALGMRASCALTGTPDANGAHDLECWGSNQFYQLRDDGVDTGDTTSNFRGVPEPVPGIGKARDILVAPGRNCVLHGASDTITCWGNNQGSILGSSDETALTDLVSWTHPGAVALTAGLLHNCLLENDGQVACWGSNGGLGTLGRGEGAGTSSASAEPVIGISDAAQAVGAAVFTCARHSDGRVRCWGWQFGSSPQLVQASDGSDLQDATFIDGGGAYTNEGLSSHACAIRETGRVVCWGTNFRGALGNGETLANDDDFELDYVEVQGISDVVDVAVGGYHTCALTSDGTVHCWGWNSDNLLGLDSNVGQDVRGERLVLQPEPVPGLNDLIDIEAGAFHTCGRRRSGRVICWGRNDDGQLGDGSSIARDDIRDVVGLP